MGIDSGRGWVGMSGEYRRREGRGTSREEWIYTIGWQWKINGEQHHVVPAL